MPLALLAAGLSLLLMLCGLLPTQKRREPGGVEHVCVPCSQPPVVFDHPVACDQSPRSCVSGDSRAEEGCECGLTPCGRVGHPPALRDGGLYPVFISR